MGDPAFYLLHTGEKESEKVDYNRIFDFLYFLRHYDYHTTQSKPTKNFIVVTKGDLL